MYARRFIVKSKPLRGAVVRRGCICKVQAAWSVLGGAAKAKSYPPLTYSVNRQDVTGVELGMLLAVSHTDAMVGRGATPLCRQNYSYWCSHEGLRHVSKLELALRRSVAAVACFTTWDVYADADSSGTGIGATSTLNCSASGDLSAPTTTSTTAAATAHPNPHRQLHHMQQLWQQQEEECTLTAALHERHRQHRRLGANSISSDIISRDRWALTQAAPDSSAPTPPFEVESTYGAGETASAAAASSSSSPSQSSCSLAATATATGSTPSRHGSKPAHPTGGVPDMDWNWLMPLGASTSTSASSRSRVNQSSGSSGSATSSSGRNPSSGDGGRGGGGPPSSSPSSPSAAGALPLRRRLVGFARASGDSSLVATIHDIAVHPSVRGQGIGGRLVKLLLQQIHAKSVYDIGVVTPTAAMRFWDRCSFDDDREGSTFMIFMGRPLGHSTVNRPPACRSPSLFPGDPWDTEADFTGYEDFGAPRNAQDLMQSADLGYWNAAQKSESLQALLAKRLDRMREGGNGAFGAGGSGCGRLDDGRLEWSAPRSRGGVTTRAP